MDAHPPRFWELFFAVYEALPRQGPGSRACAAQALALCGPQPPRPQVLDLGCGSGAQTLHLAELTDARVLAIDNHAPFVTTLQGQLGPRGLAGRVTALVGDMAAPPVGPGTVDLIWSEGAAYFLGLYRRAFFGPTPRPDVQQAADQRPRELWPALLFALLLIGFGLWPAPLLDLVRPAAEAWLARLG